MYTIVVFKVLFNTSCYSSQVLSLRLEGLVQHPAGSHVFAFYLHSEAYGAVYSSILTQVPWNLWDLSLCFSPFSINDNKMNSHSHCRNQ